MSSDFEVQCSPVWYIRCRDSVLPEEGVVSEGSGVAIRLREQSNGKRCLNYLLTCAHVIRKEGLRSQLGPRYSDIRAWPPGGGYNPAHGFSLEPVLNALPIPSASSDSFYGQAVEGTPALDWSLLSFTDPAKSNDMGLPYAEEWVEVQPERGAACYAIGYPGGAHGFGGHGHAKNDTVRPSLPFGNQLVAAAGNGVIEFQGSHSRAGMSGGGVFLADTQAFTGLHRERNDSIQQLHAVSALQIKYVLSSCGYELEMGLRTSKGSLSDSLGISELSDEELSVLAASLLKKDMADCRAGTRVVVNVGARGKVAVTLSEFMADSMHRLALEGALELYRVQQNSVKDLEKKDELGLWPGASFNIEIERKRSRSAETIQEIRRRLSLMLEERFS